MRTLLVVQHDLLPIDVHRRVRQSSSSHREFVTPAISPLPQSSQRVCRTRHVVTYSATYATGHSVRNICNNLLSIFIILLLFHKLAKIANRIFFQFQISSYQMSQTAQ